MPTKSSLKSRTSTISNAFAMSITPSIRPTKSEIADLYKALQINDGQCAYCLGKCNSVDHLHPLVTGGNPTGYITNINNLVPCCSSCNSSKGKKAFEDWYLSDKNIARLLAEGLSREQIQDRYEIIVAFAKKADDPLDYKAILGDDLWNEYLKRKDDLNKALQDNQLFCDKLNQIIMKKLGED